MKEGDVQVRIRTLIFISVEMRFKVNSEASVIGEVEMRREVGDC